MSLRPTLLSLAVLALLATSASAQTLYRWTDAQGKVHYTDSPPPSSAKESRTVNTDAAADKRAADNLREQNAAIAVRAADRGKSPEDRDREKKEADRKSRCANLLNIVTAFERGDTIYRENEKGAKTELKNADRDIERLRNNQQFQLECSDLASSSLKQAAAAAKAPAAAAKPATPNTGASGATGATGASGAPSSAGGASSGAAPRSSTGGGGGAPGSTAAPSGK